MKHAAPITVVTLLATYVGTYFLATETDNVWGVYSRTFKVLAPITPFKPLAIVEVAVRRQPVMLIPLGAADVDRVDITLPLWRPP